MKRSCISIFVLSVALLWILPSEGYARGRNQQAEGRILKRLEARSPKAVPLWKQATALLDAGRLQEAAVKYREVLRLAPDFPDGLRRLSAAEPSPTSALSLARKAYKLAATPENLSAVIQALVRTVRAARAQAGNPEGWRPTGELKKLYWRLVPLAKDDFYTYVLGAQVALTLEDTALLKVTVSNLRRLAPDEMLTHYFAGILAILEKDWETAEREIKRAQALGLPAAEANRLLNELGVSSKARRWRVIRYTGYTAAIWAVGLIVLLLAGMILSWLTLATVRNDSPEATAEPSLGISIVRKVYAVLLGITSLYFYVSIPMILLLVVAAAGGVLYALLTVGHIPIYLVLVVIGSSVVTIYSMIKSLFIRVRDEDPGERLETERAPELYAVLREVAARVDTRPVDTVYLVPDTTIAVMERGAFWSRLSGKSERCLILGLGALEGLTQVQLKSILAHEYGHFSNQDTAGGRMALRVRNSIAASAQGLMDGGAATWYNPAWLFLNGFHRIFLRVSHGASRLQEVLADRWAAVTYGKEPFAKALRHNIRRTIEFELLVTQEVDSALEQQRAVHNIYTLSPPETLSVSDPAAGDDASEKPFDDVVAEALAEALEEPASAYDSHPPPNQRIAWLERLEGTPMTTDAQQPCWDLLRDAPTLQAQMTEGVNDTVEQIREMDPNYEAAE